MKIAVLCNDRMALPALNYLSSENLLAGIATPNSNLELMEQLGIIALKSSAPIRTITKKRVRSELESWLDAIGADTLWILTFPYKIPESILEKMGHNVFNFHFAKLPEYRGPNPIFWQIKNQETMGGISVYQLDKGWDTGPLAFHEEVPIHTEDNYGLHQSRLGFAGIDAAKKLIEFLKDPNWQGKLTPQDESKAGYPPRPEFENLVLDWTEMEQMELVALIKSANPWNKGAYTAVKGMPLRIVEVTPANSDQPIDALPGAIVVTDAQQGMFVACKGGKLLRIDIVFTVEGYMTGFQLQRLGIVAGDTFVPIALPSNE